MLTDGEDAALKRAIETAGGTRALAKALGLSSPAVSQWKRVPAERCLEVERLTGVSRYELRPDVYGTAEAARGLAAVREELAGQGAVAERSAAEPARETHP